MINIRSALSVKLSPSLESEGRLTGILHWPATAEIEGHCLMRWISRESSSVVVLSALWSCSPKGNFLNAVAPVANAAYRILEIDNPNSIIWITHAGAFSTADSLWTSTAESFTQVSLDWNETEFEDSGDWSNYDPLFWGSPEHHPLLETLALDPVNDVLAELGWIEGSNATNG